LTSIKLFYERDIKINDEPKRDPKLYDPELYNPELYNEGEGNISIIPYTILAILLKYSRG